MTKVRFKEDQDRQVATRYYSDKPVVTAQLAFMSLIGLPVGIEVDGDTLARLKALA